MPGLTEFKATLVNHLGVNGSLCYSLLVAYILLCNRRRHALYTAWLLVLYSALVHFVSVCDCTSINISDNFIDCMSYAYI